MWVVGMAHHTDRMKRELAAFVADVKADKVSLDDVLNLAKMTPSEEREVEEVASAVAALNSSQGQEASAGRF